GSGASVTPTPRSALSGVLTTVVVALAVLFDASGSASEAETLTLFVSRPGAVGLTTTLTTEVPLMGRLPRAQVRTWAASVQVGDGGFEETKLTPAGSVSTSV